MLAEIRVTNLCSIIFLHMTMNTMLHRLCESMINMRCLFHCHGEKTSDKGQLLPCRFC